MFNLSNVETNRFDVLPAGIYAGTVTSAEIKDAKSGGQYLKLEFTLSGGRKVWSQMTTKNANEKAVQIGLSQLKSLLIESGYADPNNLGSVSELLGLKVGVKTKVTNDPTYGEKAEVHYFVPLSKVAHVEAMSADDIPNF